MIIITASITPYFAFGKATPLILLGLNSLLLFSSDIKRYRVEMGATICSAQNLFFITTQ